MARYQVTDPGQSWGHKEGGRGWAACLRPGQSYEFLSGSPLSRVLSEKEDVAGPRAQPLATSAALCFVTLKEVPHPPLSHV